VTFPDVLFHEVADRLLFTPERPRDVDSERRALPAVQRETRDRPPNPWFPEQ